MGVAGLWDLLRPAAARTSLSTLSREAFMGNRDGLRALTVGVDASIWIFHAATPHYGENPFLRTIFFKITALLQHPVLPVFVFDGPNKPNFKRNQRVAGRFGTHDSKSRQFKALLDVCGLEWWNAPGEAEAELAVMNRQGKIDVVLSDDGDSILFGAKCLIRNPSPTLSGAQASATAQGNSARADQRQYEVYKSTAIRDLWAAKEGTELKTEEDCRMAMVFVALLSGGDYTPEGLPSIGPTISHGLASAGLSMALHNYHHDKTAFEKSLPSLQSRIVEELRTNETKQVGRRYPERANKLSAIAPTELFPPATLEAYLNPCTSPLDSPSEGWPGFGKGTSSIARGKARDDGRGDMEGLAAACEKYFEWGTKDLVCKKFAGESVGVFGAELMNTARENVRSRAEPSGTPARITSFFQQSVGTSSPAKSGDISRPTQLRSNMTPAHVIQICSARPDPTNPALTEYRISFDMACYVERCHEAMLGTRVDPCRLNQDDRDKIGLVGKGRSDSEETLSVSQAAPKSEIRVWLQEYLVSEAWPGLVKAYEEKLAAKDCMKNKAPIKQAASGSRATGGAKKGRALEVHGEDVGAFESFFTRKTALLPKASPEEPEPVKSPRERKSPQSSQVIDLSLSSPPASPAQRASSLEKKKLSRPALSSSISSAPSAAENSGAKVTRRQGRKKVQRVKATSDKTISPGSEVHTLQETSSQAASGARRFTQRTFQKSVSSPSSFPIRPMASKSNDVIDLCSSSEEDKTPIKLPAPPPRRRVARSSSINPPTATEILSPSSRENEPHERKSTRGTRSTSLSASAEKSVSPRSQVARGVMVLGKTFTALSPPPPTPPPTKTTKAKERTKEQPGSPKPRKPRYKVISVTDDMEILDCTMRR